MGRLLSPFLLTALALVAILTTGCGSERLVVERDDLIVERRPDPAYDPLFPAYVELCATSQFRPKGMGFGGVPGHALMYVKGACKDDDAPYPQLRRCRRAATDPYDPEHGAGVSVNRWLRNVNWIAIPGNALFYAGNLPAGDRLTRAHLRALEGGGTQEETFPTYRRLVRQVRRANVDMNRVLLKEPVKGKVYAAGEILGRIRPFYEEAPPI